MPLVKERTRDGHAEYTGTAGGVSINYDKSVTDGDIGIFKMCFQSLMNRHLYLQMTARKMVRHFFPYAAC